jgi:hypothetical protein
MCPIYKVWSGLTTDPFATPEHAERDVEPERSRPNSAYSRRITRYSYAAEPRLTILPVERLTHGQETQIRQEPLNAVHPEGRALSSII